MDVYVCVCVGEKFLIRWFRGYLISVTVGGRVGGRVSLSSSQGGTSDAMTLTIYDITNQFIGKTIVYTHVHNSSTKKSNHTTIDPAIIFCLVVHSPSLSLRSSGGTGLLCSVARPSNQVGCSYV